MVGNGKRRRRAGPCAGIDPRAGREKAVKKQKEEVWGARLAAARRIPAAHASGRRDQKTLAGRPAHGLWG